MNIVMMKRLTMAAMLLLTSVSIANAAKSENFRFNAEIDPNVSADTFTRVMMDNDIAHFYRPQGEVKFDLQLKDRVGSLKIAFTKLYEVREPELDTSPSKVKTFEVNAKCYAPQVIDGTSSIMGADGKVEAKIRIFKVSCFTMLDPVRSAAGEPGDVQIQLQQYPNGKVRAWMTILDEKRDLTYHLLSSK